jgi:hypothetical protein
MKEMQQQVTEVEEEISKDDDKENAQQSLRKKNICFICQKPVTRLPRHLKKHKEVVKREMSEIEMKLKKFRANHEFNLKVIREEKGGAELYLANNKKTGKIKPYSGRCPDKTYKLEKHWSEIY